MLASRVNATTDDSLEDFVLPTKKGSKQKRIATAAPPKNVVKRQQSPSLFSDEENESFSPVPIFRQMTSTAAGAMFDKCSKDDKFDK